jgi:hypothetical protein
MALTLAKVLVAGLQFFEPGKYNINQVFIVPCFAEATVTAMLNSCLVNLYSTIKRLSIFNVS